MFATPIDPPTLAVTIEVNDSPLAGTEGSKVQSRVIRERLFREAEGNVAIRVSEAGEKAFEVAGRGELQLGVLIETMRREGFELAVCRPRVLYKTDPATGALLEPIEDVQIDLDDAFVGIVIDKLNQRKGELSTCVLRAAARRASSCASLRAGSSDTMAPSSRTRAAPAS